MPTVDSVPTGAPIWIELFSSDPRRAEDFYGQLFGWTATPPNEEFGGYQNFTKDGTPIAGLMRNDGSAGVPDFWTTYLATPDAAATTEAARAAGGQVHLEPMPVADLGTMGMVADPGNAAVGLWQPGTHRGYGLWGEAGTPVWHELHTRDYAGVLEFYRTVFGWETKVAGDTDEFRYSTMEADGESKAGVMDATAFLPEGVPSAWLVYFGSEDVDATIAQVERLGGSVLLPAEDTPFGRLAQVADPTGTVFKLSSLQS